MRRPKGESVLIDMKKEGWLARLGSAALHSSMHNHNHLLKVGVGLTRELNAIALEVIHRRVRSPLKDSPCHEKPHQL